MTFSFISLALMALAALLALTTGQTAAPITSPCGDWLPYKDEKCFKIVDDNFRTFDDAQKVCAQIAHNDNEPSLAIIQSKEEQDFLTAYLYKTSKKEENFWIGVRHSAGKFHHVDGTDLGYTNWDPKGFKNHADYCVQMQADEKSQGLWIDEPCDFKKNLVVCQRIQSWSLPLLHKVFLNTRKQLVDELAAAKSVAASLQAQVTANRVTDLIPAGFTYVQLPGEKEPAAIWPFLKWTEVSKAYEGVFFRVVGGGANAFGAGAQAEQAPVITQVDSVAAAGVKLAAHPITKGVTDVVSTGSNGDGKVGLVFHQIVGEVRPRNMAVRVWKRA